MTGDWSTILEQCRSDAAAWLDLCEGRYNHDAESVPLLMARRWLRALSSDPIDMDELSSVVRESDVRKSQHDIAYHTWCNDIVQIYRSLWEAHPKRAMT